jgi:hypothetical protein
MSMGQQLGSATKPNVLAGMTPAAGNKALPGAQPGKPPANQLQQALQPVGAQPGRPMGPVAPGPLPGGYGAQFDQPAGPQFESQPGAGLPAQNRPQPVAPQSGTGGMGSITGLTQNTTQQRAQIQQRNQMRQARGGGY